MTELPSDWGSYSRTCSKCGARYHESGTEQCDCEPCKECTELVPPDEYVEQDGLCKVHFEQKLEDEDVEPDFTIMVMDEDGTATTKGDIGTVHEILSGIFGK